MFFLGHFSLGGVGSTAWLLVLAGMIGVAGYLALYRGLESGHIGLVSAISACYGGVIAVLSVVLLHEQLTVGATVGIVATVVGVMLGISRCSGGTYPTGGSSPASPRIQRWSARRISSPPRTSGPPGAPSLVRA